MLPGRSMAVCMSSVKSDPQRDRQPGQPLEVRVTREARDSTYRVILALIEAANCSAVLACPFRSCMTDDPGAHITASTVGRNPTTAEHQDVRHKGNRRDRVQGGHAQRARERAQQ